MKKLSDLVAFRNQLKNFSVEEIKTETRNRLDLILHEVTVQQDSTKLDVQLKELLSSFAKFDQEFQRIKKEIDQQIEEQEKPWFQESYRLYEEEMCFETTDYILNRRLRFDADKENMLHHRLMGYTSWKYPGMIIRPGLETFIDEMVSFDPLYLIDEEYDLLTPATARYPLQYQRRLRNYTVNEDQDILLPKIPDNQFGICFAYNFFNFRPFEVIRRYLTEIYAKLKPGGVLILTFNDCDRESGVKLVENHFSCYTPGYLVRELAYSIGYTELFSWNDNGPSTWLELKKPGELESLRGGQTLAKISDKNSIDNPAEKVYNENTGISPQDLQMLKIKKYLTEQQELVNKAKKLAEVYQIDITNLGSGEIINVVNAETERRDKIELDQLKKIAIDLKLDDPNLIRYGYTLNKLRELILKRRST